MKYFVLFFSPSENFVAFLRRNIFQNKKLYLLCFVGKIIHRGNHSSGKSFVGKIIRRENHSSGKLFVGKIIRRENYSSWKIIRRENYSSGKSFVGKIICRGKLFVGKITRRENYSSEIIIRRRKLFVDEVSDLSTYTIYDLSFCSFEWEKKVIRTHLCYSPIN